MARVVLLLSASCLLLAVAAGCGGGGDSGGSGGDRLSKSEYEKVLSNLGTELTQQFGSLGATPATRSALAAYFRKQADGWDELTSRLAAINPPAEIDDAHKQLVAATRSITGDLRAAAKKGPSARLLNLSKLAGFQQVQDALKEITAKGYSFNSGTVTTTVQGGSATGPAAAARGTRSYSERR